MTLIERDLELDAVDGWLADVTGGTGSVLVVEGTSGIGKTALLSAPVPRRVRAGCGCLPR